MGDSVVLCRTSRKANEKRKIAESVADSKKKTENETFPSRGALRNDRIASRRKKRDLETLVDRPKRIDATRKTAQEKRSRKSQTIRFGEDPSSLRKLLCGNSGASIGTQITHLPRMHEYFKSYSCIRGIFMKIELSFNSQKKAPPKWRSF